MSSKRRSLLILYLLLLSHSFPISVEEELHYHKPFCLQAIYNLDLGMDLLKKVDIPTQIKQHSQSLSNLLKEIAISLRSSES